MQKPEWILLTLYWAKEPDARDLYYTIPCIINSRKDKTKLWYTLQKGDKYIIIKVHVDILFSAGVINIGAATNDPWNFSALA